MFNNSSPPTENLVVYEVMRKNTVVPGRPQMAVRHARFVCCIIKATNTRLEYVIRTAFFPATIVARSRLGVTLYVYCQPCFVILIYHVL